MRFSQSKVILFLFFAALCLIVGCGGGKKGSTGGALPSNGGGGGTSLGSVTFSVSSFGAGQTGVLISTQQPGEDNSTTTASATVASTTGKEGGVASKNDLLFFMAGDRDSGEVLRRDLPTAMQNGFRSRISMSMFRHAPCSAYDHSSNANETFSVYTGSGKTPVTLYNRTPGGALKSLIFVEQQGGTDVISAAAISSVVSAFETKNPYDSSGQGIYDRMRTIFGSEWTSGGGNDGEPQIILCFLSSTTLGGNSLFGYTNEEDELSCKDEDSGNSSIPNSNQGEIIYLNSTYFNQTSDGVSTMFDGLATIAHEFQHLINFNNKYLRQGNKNGTEENTTINEGLSIAAEQELGFGLSPIAGGGSQFVFNVINSYENNPHGGSAPSFFSWAGTNRDYGKGFLLMNYIRQRFGLSAISSIAASSSVGSSGIAGATGASFSTLFQDWARANYLDGVSGASSTYQYSNLNMKGTYTIRNALTGATSSQTFPGISMAAPAFSAAANNSLGVTLQPWTAAYFSFGSGNGSPLTVSVSAPTSTQSNFIYEAPSGTFNSIQ